MKPLVILLLTQMIYTVSDFMGRYYMSRSGFQAATFLSWWFLGYQVIRQVAMFGQLYVFAYLPLGKTMAMLGAASIVFSNLLGFFFLKEMLSPVAYVGVFLAVTAILIMAVK